MRKALGLFLILSPFIAMFIFMTITTNIWIAIGIFIAPAILYGIIRLGLYLME